MNSPQLDPSKLYGFKIVLASSGAGTNTPLSLKVGGKEGLKVGSKIGSKVGGKKISA